MDEVLGSGLIPVNPKDLDHKVKDADGREIPVKLIFVSEFENRKDLAT